MFKRIDKTTLSETIRIATPAMLESFFGALASFVDSKMVSSLGTAAVASVALTTQPMLLRLTPFTAINVALAALVARRKGEGKREDAHRVFSTALVLTLILSVVITLTFTFLASPIITISGSNADTHDLAVTYFRVLAIGTAVTAIQNVICAAHRGSGFTKITMWTHVVSNIINVGLNYLLIEGHLGFPRLEIFGAALATMIGSAVACVLAILSLFGKKTYIQLKIILESKLKPRWIEIKQILRIAYSVFIEQVLIRVGFFLNNLLAANLGTNALAAHRVAGNFTALSFSFGDGLSTAAVALVGRSLGEGSSEKARKYLANCRLLGVIATVVIAVMFALFIRPMFGLFFTDQAVVDIGVSLTVPIIIAVLSQIINTINLGTLRGAGDTLFAAIVVVIFITLMRPTMGYFLAYKMELGVLGLWISTDIDLFGRVVASSIRLAGGKWTKRKI